MLAERAERDEEECRPLKDAVRHELHSEWSRLKASLIRTCLRPHDRGQDRRRESRGARPRQQHVEMRTALRRRPDVPLSTMSEAARRRALERCVTDDDLADRLGGSRAPRRTRTRLRYSGDQSLPLISWSGSRRGGTRANRQRDQLSFLRRPSVVFAYVLNDRPRPLSRRAHDSKERCPQEITALVVPPPSRRSCSRSAR